MNRNVFSLLAIDFGIIIGVIAAVVVVAVLIAAFVVANHKKNARAASPKESAESKPVEPAASSEPAPQEQPVAEQSVAEAQEQPVEEPVAEQPAEVVEEPQAAEEEPVAQEEPAAEEVSEAPAAQEPAVETEEPAPTKAETRIIRKVVYVPQNRLVNVRYDRSFTARLIQTTDQNKAYYSELKNELLSYSRVKSRISWKQETYRRGRVPVARLGVRGKTLCLYLALDPLQYENTKYLVEDVSDKKKNEQTPCMYRIKNDRRLRYAKDLIADVLKDTDAKKSEPAGIDYAVDYPYEETEPLLERELIKLVEIRANALEDDDSLVNGELELEVPLDVTVAAAEELLKDEIAQALVRESDLMSTKGFQTIVNVDTLGEYFRDGETVTLELMHERIPFLNPKATRVKVLARGMLNKALNVEADDFSLAAVKMIVLAGGDVFRKRRF